MKTEQLRWGLMSTARINERIIPGIRRSERAELLAVASRTLGTAKTYAAKWDIPKAHGSYEDLLSDPEVDAVYISLPNSMHLEWAVKSAEAGKHILCEKPIALIAEDVDTMYEAARRNGVTLQEATMMLYHAQTFRVRELISSGAIGEIRTLRGIFNNKQSDVTDIRLIPEMGGGSLWDTGIYAVNFMRTMTGIEPTEVHAWQVNGSTGVDMTFMAHMRFANGVLAEFQCGFDALPYTEADIIGSQGMIRLDLPWVNQPGETANVRISRIPSDPPPGSYGDTPADNQTESETFEDIEPYGDQVKAVTATILDGAPPVISADDSRRNIAAVVALYESARMGRIVTL